MAFETDMFNDMVSKSRKFTNNVPDQINGKWPLEFEVISCSRILTYII